jgi:hypothetical protein
MTPAIPSERDRADTAKACLLDLNATTTTVGHQPDPMMELLESKKFRDDIDPPTEDPVITCRGLTLGTAGNIGNIQGKTKTAKTTGPFQCILASAMGGSGDDVLDFAVNNPDRLPVTYLDLEMSNYHFYRMVRGAMDRAGITKLPPWVRAYSLTELSATKRMEALQRITDEPHRMVMVDGWSDLMQDINDLERATIFADEIQARVIAYDFHIAGVLHENPSGGSGSKMRGHLGTIMANKGEFSLTCERDGDLIQMWTPLCRNRPIMESEAIGMTYDERRGMFVKASNKAAIRAMDKQEEMIRTLIEVSRGDPNSAWRYAELVERIMDVEKKSEPTAKRRVKELVGINLIFQQTGTGYYHLVSLVKDRINGTRGQ